MHKKKLKGSHQFEFNSAEKSRQLESGKRESQHSIVKIVQLLDLANDHDNHDSLHLNDSIHAFVS